MLELPTGKLENVSFDGLRLTAALEVTPVPVNARLCGLPLIESVMVTVPVRAPAAAGVNVTLIVQVDEAFKVAGQLLVCPKSPWTWMPVMVSAALPVFDTVTTCAALELPSSWLVKVSVAGVRLTAPPMPVPVKLIM